METEEVKLQVDDVQTNKLRGVASDINNCGISSPFRVSNCSTEKDSALPLCRVCHCSEPDMRGDAALEFLGISPPSQESSVVSKNPEKNYRSGSESSEKNGADCAKYSDGVPGTVEFVSPEGEVFLCSDDLEAGFINHEDSLIYLGCSCKNELALAHYACALKWFINHGSTICEICGSVAENVRLTDFLKVLASLKDYDELRERTATGQTFHFRYQPHAGVDPDAVAGIRRQRLSDISSWFNPHSSNLPILQGQMGQVVSSPSIDFVEHNNAMEIANTRQAIESTGCFLAFGLIMVALAWFVAPHFRKRGAMVVFQLLLGGVCLLAAVICLRLATPKLQFGPTRYWGISFVSWFLVLGVWSSRTYNIRHS